MSWKVSLGILLLLPLISHHPREGKVLMDLFDLLHLGADNLALLLPNPFHMTSLLPRQLRMLLLTLDMAQLLPNRYLTAQLPPHQLPFNTAPLLPCQLPLLLLILNVVQLLLNRCLAAPLIPHQYPILFLLQRKLRTNFSPWHQAITYYLERRIRLGFTYL